MSLSQSSVFAQTLMDCGLMDLGARGYQFTWSNKQEDEGLIEERLDRFVANEDWKLHFPGAMVKNMAVSESDHVPIMLELLKMPSVGRRKARGFKFEAMWLRQEGCKEIVENA